MSEKLTVMQRSCLLRGARQRLVQLDDELRGLKIRGDTSKYVTTLEAEIACLHAGIQWLWRQGAEDAS